MPRFVVLEHDWPTPHFDFLLEAGDLLRAFRLVGPPTIGVNAAEPNLDHRKLYLDYEGEVSGGRGRVRRWDAGTFEWIDDTPGRVVVELCGEKLTGRVDLRFRANPDREGGGERPDDPLPHGRGLPDHGFASGANPPTAPG
jgi:hypothetical protein